MIAYLTSTLGCSCLEDGKWKTRGIDESNGLAEGIRKVWKPGGRCCILSADPKAWEMNDSICNQFAESIVLTGMDAGEVCICDSRNSSQVMEQLDSYDVLVLFGGHVPTQNAFFQQIGLKEKIADFDGLLLGISAGTMNSAGLVYAQPELQGESTDPSYVRFMNGLGLMDFMVIPHFQAWREERLDGKRILEEITYPDSMGRQFYALCDGSYILLEGARRLLCGEAYLIKDGTLRKICETGEKKEL